ncbi:hypothetical protein [Kineobactrum salinum]|uniref:Uncharacterized protein n=1 Tax=Kineobactrum salinum TaxID=2708301 RepID=A0A6C0U253_9GAMM|nr:hypothetical protein [Kineobactrum salinum]QIB65067.1 hypothetical protein G3T16_06300 [Kineobactrum salinum]
MSKNIWLFSLLWWAHQIVAIVSVFFLPESTFLTDHDIGPEAQLIMGSVGKILVALVLLPFFLAIVLWRQKWARWVLLVSFILSIANLLLDPAGLQAANLPSTFIQYLSVLIGAVAFFFLFSSSTRMWFYKSPGSNEGSYTSGAMSGGAQ